MQNTKNRSFEVFLPNTALINTEDSMLQIFACRYNWDNPDKKPLKRETWRGYLLLFTVSGKGQIDYIGKSQIIGSGEVLCLDLSKQHGWGVYPSNHWEYYSVVFDGASFRCFYQFLFSINNIIKPANPENIKYLFDRIINLKKSNDIYFDIKVVALIYRILCELLPDINDNNKHGSHSYILSIEKAINYIKNNIESDLDISTISKIAGYSVYHFLRQFKKIIGLTPGEFIRKTRIDKAKILLLETDYSIEFIANKVGFKSANAFINSFKKYTSFTPGKFRNFPQF